MSNRFVKNLNNILMNGRNLRTAHPVGLPLGIDAASKKDFTGIDIAYAGHKGMVKEHIFDGTLRLSESLPNILEAKSFRKRLRSQNPKMRHLI
jgi:hypothetical protein